jgi:predicted nucleic acid-binding protein
VTVYLIDTSIWIRFLRGDEIATERLAELVSRRDVLVSCGPVVMELMAGVNLRNAASIDKIVRATPALTFDQHEDFLAAARLQVVARLRGLTVRSLVDCLIASIAIRSEGVVLVHCDGDFDRLAQVSSLRAERWDDAA